MSIYINYLGVFLPSTFALIFLRNSNSSQVSSAILGFSSSYVSFSYGLIQYYEIAIEVICSKIFGEQNYKKFTLVYFRLQVLFIIYALYALFWVLISK